MLSLFLVQHLYAQTKTWVSTTNDWHTAANWSPTGVPKIENESCGTIKLVGTYFNQSSARTQNDGLIQIDGDLVNAGSFTNEGTIVANT